MRRLNNIYSFSFLFVIIFNCSCSKILNEKSDKSLGLPNSIESLQNLLDFATTMNKSSASWGEGAADNLYIPDEMLGQKSEKANKAYVWSNFEYDGTGSDWTLLYNTIYVANLVIEEINKISPSNNTVDNWKNVLGSAFFFRAQSYLQGAFIFCRGYDSATAFKDYGMALRQTSDFNKPSKRSTLVDTYNLIISDLLNAAKLLSTKPISSFRPSKEAAFGLLSRTYLSMRKYNEALKYADSCLQIHNKLLDYNSLDLSQLLQFSYDNPEIIFYRCVTVYSFASASPLKTRVDTTLYRSFEDDDLRKYAYFYSMDPGFIFKGSYSANFSGLFSGIASDEIYLNRAECLARKGQTTLAMNDLNTVLKNRWKINTFTPLKANSPADALDKILKERRKELMFRCLRWMDIKRLNLEGKNIELKRIVNGIKFILEPNSFKYALPLPFDVVNIYNIPQNIY